MLAVVTVVDDGGDARTAPKASVWLCLANFLEGFGTNNTVNIDVFGASQTKNNGMRKVFEFLPLVATTTVFTVFCGQHGILKWTATFCIIRQQGWPPSPLLRTVKLKVAPLEHLSWSDTLVAAVRTARLKTIGLVHEACTLKAFWSARWISGSWHGANCCAHCATLTFMPVNFSPHLSFQGPPIYVTVLILVSASSSPLLSSSQCCSSRNLHSRSPKKPIDIAE